MPFISVEQKSVEKSTLRAEGKRGLSMIEWAIAFAWSWEVRGPRSSENPFRTACSWTSGLSVATEGASKPALANSAG